MIIREMRADFGCLNGRTLSLKPGLNVIEAPNESGKSTWCAFLRCMLYGVDSSRRSTLAEKPDKLRFAPWNGTAMAGELVVRSGGRKLRITRTSRNSAYPLRELSVSDCATGEFCPEYRANELGEMLVGASEEVFCRTAFLRGNAMGIGGSAELEKRMAALLSAGEEVSYSETASRLGAWQRKRRWHGKGELPETETELAALNSRLHAIERATEALEALEEQGEALMQEREKLRKELEAAEESERAALLRELEQARENSRFAEENALSDRRESERLCQKRDASPFALLSGEEVDAIARSAEEKQKARGFAALYPVGGLFLLAALALLLLRLPIELVLSGAGLAVLCLFAGVFCTLRKKRLCEEARKLLSPFGAANGNELSESWEAYLTLCEACETALLSAAESEEEAELSREELRVLEGELASLRRRTESEPRYRELNDRIEKLRERCATARGELNAMGDTMVLKSRALALEERRKTLERELSALSLAQEVLAEASDELQGEFTPTLAGLTAEYMERLTGGRYTELSLSRDLRALLRRGNDTVMHEQNYLSRGAWDQLYLALRLALCELVLGGEEPCPIVLDDALTAFDDERLGYAVELLAEIAKKRQVILFTCQSREAKALKRLRDTAR